MRAEPGTARYNSQRNDAGQVAIGWLAALLLHAGLLAALIVGEPVPLPPPRGQTVVSLLVLPPGQKQQGVPVQPKPPGTPVERPAGAASVIANGPPRLPVISRPIPSGPPAASPARPAPPVQAAQSGAANQAPALTPQGFVSAKPSGGNVNQPPAYPQAAVDHGEQGRVLLSIHVLPDGRTDFVSVTRGSGYRVLDQAARDAVLNWRFQPATMAGHPVVMVIPFWINFDLQTYANGHKE